MTRHVPWPETFPADFAEVYDAGGNGLERTAEILGHRYRREISGTQISSWAKRIGLKLRNHKGAIKAARASNQNRMRPPPVTVRDVQAAEAAGEIVRAPARQEAPLDVPFGSPEPGTFRFSELPAAACRWCVSPDHWPTKDFRFCGRPQQAGKPYCEEHQAAAYRVPTAAEDKRLKHDFKRNAGR